MGGGLRGPADRPMPSERPADYWLAKSPVAAGGIVAGRIAAERPGPAARPPGPDYPAVPPYLLLMPRTRRAAGNGRRAAALSYLTVPVPVVPLVIYLGMLRRPGAAHRHAAQALNVWFTGALYDLAAVTMAAMLALDSPRVALIVFAPLIGARWLVTLVYLARAARAASRGTAYAFPAWLCMRAVRWRPASWGRPPGWR